MKSQLLKSIICIAAIVLPTAVFAGNFGSAAEAKAMLERAIEAMKEDKAAALAAFTAGEDGFKDRDLYVACFIQDEVGNLTAHGGLAKLVGTSGYELTDKKGTNLGDLLNHNTKGHILSATYWWPRPGSEEPVEKESYFATIDGQNCLVGYYK